MRGFVFLYLNFLDFSFAFYSENRELSQSNTIKRSRFGEEGTVLMYSLSAVQSQGRQDSIWVSPRQFLTTKRDSGVWGYWSSIPKALAPCQAAGIYIWKPVTTKQQPVPFKVTMEPSLRIPINQAWKHLSGLTCPPASHMGLAPEGVVTSVHPLRKA